MTEIAADRWRGNWRAVAAGGAEHFRVPRSRTRRSSSVAAARGLAAGTPVVLSASAPRATARCKAFASAAGIAVERDYLAFPTTAAPAYLVENARGPVSLFVRNILMAPPRARFSLLLEIGFGLLRRSRSWRLVRVLAPGHVVVGRRT